MTNVSQKPLSPREDSFCRLVASGTPILEAAQAAGYAPADAQGRGTELWVKPEIQARIAACAAELEAERTAVMKGAAERLDRIAERAMEKGQFRTALRAIELRLRMLDQGGSRHRRRSPLEEPVAAAPARPQSGRPQPARTQPARTQPAPPHPPLPLTGTLASADALVAGADPLAEIRARIEAEIRSARLPGPAGSPLVSRKPTSPTRSAAA